MVGMSTQQPTVGHNLELAAQLALAWTLAQRADVVPAPGTKRHSYLFEDGAARDVELTVDELVHIDEVLPVKPDSATTRSKWREPTAEPSSAARRRHD
jgi:aryl-alcohol dehydrogenase-like predicted oxidoreductase